MKSRFPITGCMTALAFMSAAAETREIIGEPVKSDFGIVNAGDYIPAQFSKDGECRLTFSHFDNNNGQLTATSVDSDLATNREIEVSSGAEDYDWYMGEYMGKVLFKWDNIERTEIGSGYQDYAYTENFLYNRTGQKFVFKAKYILNEGSSDGMVFLSQDVSYSKKDGIKVPWWFFYTNNDGELTEVKCTGNCTVEDYFQPDTLDTRRYRTPLISPKFIDYDNGTSSLGVVSLTQTLFDDDEAYEYLSPIYSAPDKEINKHVYDDYIYDFGSHFGSEALFYGSRNCYIVGFRIMKEDGTELQSVLFEDGLTASSENFITILNFGGKKYLNCALNGSTVLYEINAAGNGVRNVATYKTRVYPTVVESDRDINIVFGDDNRGEQSINISDLSGKKVYSGKADSRHGSASVPASVMSKGMNIVTVSDSGGESVSTKVIVK